MTFNSFRRTTNSQKAFTLVEILVVIAIIGLLTTIILVSTVGTREKAEIAKTLQWSGNVQSLLGADAVGIWSLDENPAIHGTTIADLSGWGNNGILYTNDGATNKSVPGVVNNALSFDGVNDYVSVPNNSSLQITGELTLIFWQKLNSWACIPFNKNYSYVGEFQIVDGTNPALIHWLHGDGSYEAINSFLPALTLNVWQQIAIVRTVTPKKIYGYLNGVDSVGGKSYAKTVVADSTVLTMGQRPTNVYPCNGLIDEVHIYNRALTTAQIESQYYASLDRLLAKNLIDEQEYQQRLAMH